ncbi:MAG TPA: site-specific DNA-methyltransferase [Pirellulaceae bacterium]|nr:site-specific DNA-methyltransferase [Pirellulaceae bacterium]
MRTCILAGCPSGGTVLDPFLGSGTTAVVAQKLGRPWLGIDCAEEYCEMARRRLASGEA